MRRIALVSGQRSLALVVLLVCSTLGSQRPAHSASLAAPARIAQLRRAAEDPYLSAEQRAYYCGRLAKLEQPMPGQATDTTGTDEGKWTRYAQSPRRSSAMVVHDTFKDRLIMFGGISADGLTSEVDEVSLNGPRLWHRLQTQGPGPVARIGAAVIYDPDLRRLMVYGGSDQDGAYLDDLWTLALDGPPVWTLHTASGQGPGARANASAVHDTLHHRMLVTCGADGSFSPPIGVWSLPLVANPIWATLPTTGAPPAPGARAFHDPGQNAMLVLSQSTVFPYSVILQQLALESPYAWSALPIPCCGGPNGAAALPLAFDPDLRMLVVWNNDYIPGSCYRMFLNNANLTWDYLYEAPTGPSQRSGTTRVFDRLRHRTILIGGQTGGYNYEAEVWSCGINPMQWTPEVTPLTRRNGHAMALDVVQRQLYLFGGTCDTTAYSSVDRASNGLWRMTLGDSAAWQRMPSRGGPMLGRSQSTLVHDVRRNRLLAFGGQRGGIMTNEVWAYALSDTTGWARLLIPGVLPRQRASHAALYDSSGDRMVVFGGYDVSTALADLWALAFSPTPHWERLLPAGIGPEPRSGMGMAFDPDSSRVLIAAGTSTSYYNGFSDDLWAIESYPTLAWHHLVVGSGYSGSYRAPGLLTYDAREHRAMLVQGYSSYQVDQTRVRTIRPGQEGVWKEWSATGPAPVSFARPVGLLDPITGRLFIQGDGEGDNYSIGSDERTYSFEIPNALLDVTPEAGVAGMSFSAYPNPSRGTFRLEWSVADPGPMEIEVFDTAGRRVTALHVPAAAGRRERTIGSPGAPLPVGLYVVRARTASGQTTRNVVVLR